MARTCAHVRLSKNIDYLIDNLCFIMLSYLRGYDQEENGTDCGAVPKWESSTYPYEERNRTGVARRGRSRDGRFFERCDASDTHPFAQNAKEWGTLKLSYRA
jgi:hypothetical protein